MTTTTKEETKSVEETPPEDETETEVKKNLNPFDCPSGGPVFSDQASKEVCPVCGCEEARNVEGEVDVSAGAEAEAEAEAGDDVEAGFGTATADSGDMDEESFDGCQEAEEAETLAALSWESYFDRCGWIG
jgi:predicted  nucleic acid-binding Zn-ribbon protein